MVGPCMEIMTISRLDAKNASTVIAATLSIAVFLTDDKNDLAMTTHASLPDKSRAESLSVRRLTSASRKFTRMQVVKSFLCQSQERVLKIINIILFFFTFEPFTDYTCPADTVCCQYIE